MKELIYALITISFISCNNGLTNVEQPHDDNLRGFVSIGTGGNTFSYRNFTSIVPIEIYNNTNQKVYIHNDRFGVKFIVEMFNSDHWDIVQNISNTKSEIKLDEGESYRDSVDLYWDIGKYRVKIPIKYENGLNDTLVTEPIYTVALGEMFLKVSLVQDNLNGKLLLELKNISPSHKVIFHYGLEPYCHITIGSFYLIKNNNPIRLWWDDSKLRWVENLYQKEFIICLIVPPKRVLSPGETFSGYVGDIFPEGEIKCFMNISVEGSINKSETIIKTFIYKNFEKK